ncbi:hypothetical protein B7755_052245 [Streptomyces sp. NBS 14/10]|uniref:hypothetical protein n=1 Tax=Streptomyces sp. NBS 14/10 TaxID=1945643 RepID=UPI000B7C73B9|nr:hypothetical protein [Streptomyces sp. NBS 14/10]KAK1176664.1 hypothetical protein B7755_052245 [Streptomyces sp. NBS 14/10]
MDVIVLSEGDTPARLAREHRYRELVEEVLLPERADLDAFGGSEATVSTSEVPRPNLRTLTSRNDNWSDEKQPSAALANARTVYHGPAARAAREVWNG